VGINYKTGEEAIMTSMSDQLLSKAESRASARTGSAEMREKRQKRNASRPGPDRSRHGGVASDFPDSIVARRNVLVALWAGKLLGLSGEELTSYASGKRFLGTSEARLASILEHDLRRAGATTSRDEIQAALIRCHRIALHQTCATD